MTPFNSLHIFHLPTSPSASSNAYNAHQHNTFMMHPYSLCMASTSVTITINIHVQLLRCSASIYRWIYSPIHIITHISCTFIHHSSFRHFHKHLLVYKQDPSQSRKLNPYVTDYSFLSLQSFHPSKA